MSKTISEGGSLYKLITSSIFHPAPRQLGAGTKAEMERMLDVALRFYPCLHGRYVAVEMGTGFAHVVDTATGDWAQFRIDECETQKGGAE